MQHHITIPLSVARFILTHRIWLVLAVVFVTALAAWKISNTPLTISAIESFSADLKAFEEYQQRVNLFGGDSDSLVFVATDEGDRLFTADKLNALRAAVVQLEMLPEVYRVVAMTELPELTDRSANPLGDMMRGVLRQQILDGHSPKISSLVAPKPWWPKSAAQQNDVDLSKFRKSMTTDSMFAGRLVSADGKSHCMVLQLNPATMTLHARWALRSKIVGILQANGLGCDNPTSGTLTELGSIHPTPRIHVAGVSVSEGWILVELFSSLKVQLPLGAIALAAIVYGMYRSLSIAGLTILIGAIASVWAVALSGVIFGKMTILVAAVPLLILVISTSDTIHIVSAFGRELSKGSPQEQALQTVITDLGGACILTSLTTLVGFLSLLAIPVTAIRHLAVVAGFGVGLALVLAVTLVPIGILWLNFKPPERKVSARFWAESATVGLVEICRWVSTRYPRSVIAFHVVVLLAVMGYALGVKFDPNLTERFHPEHPMPMDIQYFNDHFYGTNVIELFIQGQPKLVLSPESLARIRTMAHRLAKLTEIKSVSSVNDLFEMVDRSIGYPTNNHLPPTPESAQASLAVLSQFQPDVVRALITPDGDMIRMSVHTSLSGFFEVLDLSEKIESIARQELPEELSVEVSGIMPTIARSVETIVASQRTSMIFCCAVVTLMIVVAMRSLRLGILALPSNVFPLVVLVGWLGFLSPYIDSDYIIVFTIAFGIAVDDTIHFLHRYDIEYAHCKNRRQAIDLAFGYSGRAIVQTTIVLGVGLLPLALSNYLTIWMLGTYLVLTLVLSLFADLLLLPALILLFGE